jgi:hypothetical protein
MRERGLGSGFGWGVLDMRADSPLDRCSAFGFCCLLFVGFVVELSLVVSNLLLLNVFLLLSDILFVKRLPSSGRYVV